MEDAFRIRHGDAFLTVSEDAYLGQRDHLMQEQSQGFVALLSVVLKSLSLCG